MPPFEKLWPELRSRLAAAERWLLPGECLLCRSSVGTIPGDSLICAPCRARWAPLPHPCCARCGQPLTPEVACRLCLSWPPQLTGVRSAVWLEGGARRAVHLLKYEGWWRVSEPMAAAMGRHVEPDAGAVLVPVPLSAARQRSRGYNQSAVLAESLGRLLGVRVAQDALSRGRDTASQTVLTPEERRANLVGAFKASGPVPPRPILVDDVFTTGATLAEAAAALADAGVESVGAITFARAARPLADAAAALVTPQAYTPGRRA